MSGIGSVWMVSNSNVGGGGVKVFGSGVELGQNAGEILGARGASRQKRERRTRARKTNFDRMRIDCIGLTFGLWI